MGKVTACLVARDAAELLPDCIASVRNAVDEVLLVDNGSRDDTVAVARKEGARIVAADAEQHEAARNAYLEAAKTPWILVIDADERLASPLPALDASADGYALERHDFIGEGHWASTRLVRLFRRAPHIRYFDSTAHTAVAPAIARAGGRIALADTVVHHLDALLARDHHAKRANMRGRLETQLDKAPILRCFYALELFAIGDDAGAARELTTALATSAKLEPIVSLFRAQQHRVRGRVDEAEKYARHCLSLKSDVFRGRDSAWATLADALDRQGRHDEALEAVVEARAESPSVLSHIVNEHVLRGMPPPRVEPWTKAAGARPSIFLQQDALLTRYRPA
jgi:tetratricopeptide (TPR) repeat protein